ncbi:MAG: GNAT family N-acetyltransferase [Alphaproteobacteria bacterium]|nr:GNAT family N-acetyltransferase [Alphaproteobacteria bacterium]
MRANREPTLAAGLAGDARPAAALILASGRGNYEYLFAGKAAAGHRLARYWRARQGWFSHRYALTLRWRGRLLALALGYAEADGAAIDAGMLRCLAREPAALRRHLDAALPLLLSLVPRLPQDAYYLQNLVVVAGSRGQGLGTRLLRQVETGARQAGCRELHLDVAADSRALAFYRRHGYAVRAEIRVPELAAGHAIGPHCRMQKPLV